MLTRKSSILPISSPDSPTSLSGEQIRARVIVPGSGSGVKKSGEGTMEAVGQAKSTDNGFVSQKFMSL
jgi:hypothetical protein